MGGVDTGRRTLALVITGDGESVHERIRRDREQIRAELTRHGAVLLRGFDVGGVDGFDQVVRELSGTPLTYSERSTPRSRISGNVYTSTDYPPQEEIFAHNENSYQAVWPLTLYFYCVEPPLTQGATPLASTREVYASIDPEIRAEFERRKWMVVRNYSDELGLPWRESFNTDDRDEVNAYCARNGLQVEWLDGDRLRTRAVRDAVHRHPVTGDLVWFNHATFFHVTTLPEEIRLGLLEMCGVENLPNNTYYGDGGVIPDDVVEHLRQCYRAASTRFDYQRDDVLVVDNMLSTHAREPFTGPRRIAVAMAEPSAAA
ncbi:TauD/TfdA family dioxygenase [Goodfellowiella coeruleoviolacea]|uniref:Taurine dioxygenase, alpha-ketoglutarate-dependent n=1 Tax=Goodfellowiella coeruleoviolacea TaxID=334858 RepID=A0AAE3GBR3_9PSEU|nr:TauD/TfdA family dioxygenase [Goodfellowiella coeruleoviolacea]MCP2164337.1 Taurine dioxygenase, alpha-ketoglutarate-dependent [Goodfellowiella coeruleoviolacea]